MIILKVTKKRDITLSLENSILQKQRWVKLTTLLPPSLPTVSLGLRTFQIQAG